MYKYFIHKHTGFFLIELLVALSLVGMVSFLCAQYYVSLFNLQQDARMRMKACDIAQNTCELIKAGQSIDMHPVQEEGFSLSCDCTPDYQSGISLIRVTVRYESPLGAREITLKNGFML